MSDKNKQRAFPLAFPDSITDDQYVQHGMSLRDYFAAKALCAMVSNINASGEQLRSFVPHIAVEAYRFADAMLEERAK